MQRLVLVGVLSASLLGSACRSNDQADDGDAAETGSEGSGEGETGFPSADACSPEMPCEAGFCVAPWDANADPPRGPAECVPECVAELDLERFCIDDSSCCEGLECSLDGLCEPPFQPDTGTDSETDTETGTDSETDTGTDSETDTGTDSETGTDTDTGTDSDTDTGTATDTSTSG